MKIYHGAREDREIQILEDAIKGGRQPDKALLEKVLRSGRSTPIITDYLADKLAGTNRGGRPKKTKDHPATMSEWVIPALLKRVIIENPGINRLDALIKVARKVDSDRNEFGARSWKSIERHLEREHGKGFWAEYKNKYWKPDREK